MRYAKGHRAATRRRILDVAGRRFRRDGIAASGVAGVMAEAGLTNGALAGHFADKDALVRDALGDALAAGRTRLAASLAAGGTVSAYVDRYLSEAHRDDPGGGCGFAALASEAARQGAATRGACAEEFARMVDVLAEGLDREVGVEGPRARATALLGLLIGTLQAARLTAGDPVRSAEILDAGRRAAGRLLAA